MSWLACHSVGPPVVVGAKSIRHAWLVKGVLF